MEGFIYSVSMTATESTYVYDVYRFDGDSVDVRTIDFAEVVRMASEDGSQVRTPQDALSYLNERGSAVWLTTTLRGCASRDTTKSKYCLVPCTLP